MLAQQHGDSLVRPSFEQIQLSALEPEADGQQSAPAQAELDLALEEAVRIRQRIPEPAKDPSPAAQIEAGHLVRDASDALDRPRLVGEVIVGAFIAETKKQAREKDGERRRTWCSDGWAATTRRRAKLASCQRRSQRGVGAPLYSGVHEGLLGRTRGSAGEAGALRRGVLRCNRVG
ncbi:MAG: hypothetical protein VYE22_24215 [Myxococcota bacterium]|nr:hypothetical protein [Myxococcota bacterium]